MNSFAFAAGYTCRGLQDIGVLRNNNIRLERYLRLVFTGN